MTQRRRARARRYAWRGARLVPQPLAEAIPGVVIRRHDFRDDGIASGIRCSVNTYLTAPANPTRPLDDDPEGTTAIETMFGNLFGGPGKVGKSGGSVKASGGAFRDILGSSFASEMRCLLRPREPGDNRRERDLALPDRD